MGNTSSGLNKHQSVIITSSVSKKSQTEWIAIKLNLI